MKSHILYKICLLLFILRTRWREKSRQDYRNRTGSCDKKPGSDEKNEVSEKIG